MSEEYEQFNAHQEDVRRRSDSLVRAIFVLSGGALTISIGFLGEASRSLLSESLVLILQTSWWSLFMSIVSLASALFAVIIRDYTFGERWREKLDGKRQDAMNSTWGMELVIWVLALIGFFSFILGMVGLAYVSTSSISIG